MPSSKLRVKLLLSSDFGDSASSGAHIGMRVQLPASRSSSLQMKLLAAKLAYLRQEASVVIVASGTAAASAAGDLFMRSGSS